MTIKGSKVKICDM